jgi:hypothetical protein
MVDILALVLQDDEQAMLQAVGMVDGVFTVDDNRSSIACQVPRRFGVVPKQDHHDVAVAEWEILSYERTQRVLRCAIVGTESGAPTSNIL